MLNLFMIPKAVIFAVACGITVFTNQFYTQEYTEEELIVIEERVLERIEEMREATDSQWGEGFFELLSSGEMTQEDLDQRNIKFKE